MSVPAAAQTAGVHDDFNRPDAASLGTATSGQAWTSHAGAIGVAGALAAPGSSFYLASIDAGISALDAAVTLALPAHEFWLIVRFADEQNYWRFGRWQGQPYSLQQVANNSIGMPVIEAGASIAPQPGDRISCKVRSERLDCRINGTMVARTRDSFAASETRVGLSGYQGDAARFDDFAATAATLPDLSAAMLGPAGMDVGADGIWQATVENIGASLIPAADVIVTPPPALTNVTLPGGACAVEGSGWRCSLGALAAGQAVSLAIHGTAPSAITLLTFSATAVSTFEEDDVTNNTASIVTSIGLPPAPPGAIVYDNFNRPNGAAGFASTGQPWTVHFGSLAVLDGAAAPGTGFMLSSVDTAQGDGDFSATVVVPSAEFWTIFRLSDAANYWRFGRWNGEPYHLQRVGANMATPFPRTATLAPAAGDAVRCAYWHEQIECSVNGVAVAHATDAFNDGASRVGFSSYMSSTNRFDELLVKEPPPPIFDAALTIDGPSMIRIGETGSWGITFSNRGNASIAGAEVVVTPSTLLVNVVLNGPACSLQSGQYRCTVGIVPPGAAALITLSGTALAAPAVLSVSASTATLAGEIQTSDNAASHITQVRPAIPANALVVDLFDRPNTSSAGIADTGQTWLHHNGQVGIQNGEATLESPFTLATLNAGAASGDFSATITHLSQEFWLVLRLSDSQNYWRFGRSGNGAYQLQQIKGSLLGNPALQLLDTVNPAPGDQLKCRVNAFGIFCTANNVAVVRTTDTFNGNATRIGFSGFAAGAVRFDDLVFHQPPGPDLAVSATAPSIALTGQQHVARVTARNVGHSPALSPTVTIALPPSTTVVTLPPECSLDGTQVQCPLAAALEPGGVKELSLTLSASVRGAITGVVQAPHAGDTFAFDNSTAWTTAIEAAGSGIFDGFSRPDTVSGLGETLTGQTWQTLSGGFRIAGAEAHATAAGSMAAVQASFAFGTVEVVLGNSPEAAGIAFRIVDANNYYRLAVPLGGPYRVTKIVNGIVQNLQIHIQRHATVARPGDLVRVVSRPDDGIFVAVNGRHIIDGGDPQFMHATGWGLLATGAGSSFRSFALRPVLEGLAALDAFEGANGSVLGQPTSGVYYHWGHWSGPAWKRQDGAAHPSGSAYGLTTLDTSSELASVRTRLVQPGDGGWIVFRYVENGPYFRFGQDHGAAYSVEYISGGVRVPFPVPLVQLATVSPVAGDILEVRQSSDGTVECVVNGTVTHRFQDNAGPGSRSTLTGLAGFGSSVFFDDFEVTPLPR